MCLGWIDIFFSGRVLSEYRASLGSAMHPITWRADARSNYSNCEGDATAYPSPARDAEKTKWEDAEAREKERGTREKVILSRTYCARALFISRNVRRLTVYHYTGEHLTREGKYPVISHSVAALFGRVTSRWRRLSVS